MKSFPLSVLTFLGHISQEAPISQEWGNDSVLLFFFHGESSMKYISFVINIHHQNFGKKPISLYCL